MVKRMSLFDPDSCHVNHPPIGINNLFDELITAIFIQCTFPMLFALGRSCTRFYSLSKRAPIWSELCLKMQKFIPFNASGGLSLSSTNAGNDLPLYKDIFCNALQNTNQEALQRALFAECASCYYFDDAKNNLLETVHLIKKYEIAPTSEFKIKIDLLFAEALILKSEFNVKKSEEDEVTALALIQSTLSSEGTSPEEKAWATCLVGQYFFYSDDDLVLNDDDGALSDQDVLDLLNSVATNEDLPSFYRQAADLYMVLLYFLSDSEEMPPEDLYDLLQLINKGPDLFPTFKAKFTILIALMDYQDDMEVNDQIFLQFQQVSNNELAFPFDKNLAMLHQAKMRVRDLTDCISYEQTDQLLDQLVSDKFTNSTIKNQAMLYKITMNVTKRIHSMNDQEIFQKLDEFRNAQTILDPADQILIMLNMGLMLVQDRVKEFTHLNAVLQARRLFSLVIQDSAEDDTGPIGEYRALAQKELALLG